MAKAEIMRSGDFEKKPTSCQALMKSRKVSLLYSRIQEKKKLTCHADRERLQTIGNWLSRTNFPAQQWDFLARREIGTGKWFLNSPHVSEWLQEPKKTLFCPGMPGAGKTMIAATMIDHLSKKQNNNTGLAYLYCNYKAQAELDTYELLAAILKQLLLCQSKIPDSVSRLYEKHTRQNTRPSLQDISNLCFDVTMTFSTTYLVIDALDECLTQDGTRYKLLNILRRLQNRADLRIMATSRIIPEIVRQFEDGLVLEIRANDADIKRFIHGQVHRLPKCIQHNLRLQRFIEDKIAAMADGM
jgi:NACHT domain